MKMSRKIILTVSLILVVYPGYSQQTSGEKVKQNCISFTLGHSQFKDENLHPKVSSGLSLGLSFRGSVSSKAISEYNAGLIFSLMNTAFEDFPSSASALIRANYKYLFTLARFKNLTWYMGPASYFQYGTNAYFNWDESHLYYANYLSLGMGNRITCELSKKLFVFHLDIPIFSVISRPEPNRQYKIDDMSFGGVIKNLASNPEGTLPNRNFFIDTGIEMRFSTAKKKSRALAYRFRYHYMHAQNGYPFQNIENALSFKLIF